VPETPTAPCCSAAWQILHKSHRWKWFPEAGNVTSCYTRWKTKCNVPDILAIESQVSSLRILRVTWPVCSGLEITTYYFRIAETILPIRFSLQHLQGSPGRFPLLFCIPGHSPLCMTSVCGAFVPEYDVVDGMQVTDVEEADKLQTLLATCCSGWRRRRRRRRLCSAHHAACVRCCRCSRCPPGTCMSPRWTATTGLGVKWGLRCVGRSYNQWRI